ncbi:glycosyl hydrolase family 8 [Streptomyces sp. NPDC088847]|uniref:glycosyl hydrolase family 8 n=1 Tax=Streptomyces sp. NPDC088847 TaxID=3365909 RepID=UPI0037F48534
MSASDDMAPAAAQLPALDLSQANRRAPVTGLYDWSKVGYRGGQPLPGASDINSSASCNITAAKLASQYNVKPNDSVDDSTGLQAAIDAIRTTCSTGASYNKLSLITLPSGTLNVSRQLGVDADYLVIRGAGSGADGTRFVFRPDANTKYDALTEDGADWDEDGMTSGSSKGGWIWPGRGLFRVQSRGVDPSYASEYRAAPANRKDLFEGTVNVHWKVGVALRAKPGDTGFAARTGDKVVYLASNGSLTNLKAGALVNVRAANSQKFYDQQKALPTEYPLLNMHMRQQIFRIASVDSSNRTVTLDKPLEYDVPVNSTSDGSPAIDGATYASKVSPLVDPVVGVGFENFSLTQDIPGLDKNDAVHNYGNMAPAEEMHGIVFKWAADSWVRGIRTEMTGSHPIVTEEAKNLQIVDNYLDGSWNKGKGGNGYFRGSRVWDSLYAGNVSRNLRHFTFQWSASGNVVIGNDFDSDLNLHGGWERHNLFERNISNVPYNHSSGSCSANCGEEGGGDADDSTWYPIWWGAGKKAVKWSGASGPQNVFFNNELRKQTGSASGEYKSFYSEPQRIYQFGWNGTSYQHLDIGGTPIADWAKNETRDYTGGHGIDATRTDSGPSLFLKNAPALPSNPTPDPTEPTPDPSDPTDPGTPPADGVNVPFGSHSFPYAAGTIKVSGNQAANDAKVLDYYKKWKAAFVTSKCGNGWSAIASTDADHPYVAEGQGYGMTILATMAGADPDARKSFDGVLKYVLAHPSVNNADLHAAEQDKACKSVNGSDSATDGDLEIAYALLLAAKQWGNTGTYDYDQLAVRRINAIKASEVVSGTKLMNLGDWSEGTYNNISRTSDWLPGHFKAFRKATGDAAWDQILAKHQSLLADLQSKYAASTGLLPDFVVDTNTSSPRPAPGEVLESPLDGAYSWNACRDPWRLGVDALTTGDAKSLAAVRKMNFWIKQTTGGDPNKIQAGYKLNGSVAESGSEVAFIAPFAVAAATDQGSQAWLDALWNKINSVPLEPTSYYGSSIQLQVMIAITGNHWLP